MKIETLLKPAAILLILVTGSASAALTAPMPLTPLEGGKLTNRTPTFDWSDVPGATAYDLQVDNDNDFSSTVIDQSTVVSNYTPLTGLNAGTYYWRVRARSAADTSAWSTNRSFQIYTPIPTLMLPIDNSQSTDHTPAFDWSNASGATGYDLQVSPQSDFSTLALEQSVVTSGYTAVADLPVGYYYWRVRTRINADLSDWTAPFHFTIFIQTPTLIAPVNQSQQTDRTPSFDWSDSPYASSYDFQLSTDNTFTSLTLDLNLAVSAYTPTSDLQSNQTYYWRARAWVSGESGSWTAPFSFTLILPHPTLSSPLDNSQLTDHTPTFDWSDVSGATAYDLQVSSQSDFSTLALEQSTVTSGYTAVTDLPAGYYYWRVRARINSDLSDWTAPFHFTIFIQTPTLISPVNHSETTDKTPSFDWSDSPYATNYNLQVSTDSTFASLTLDLIVTLSAYTPISDLQAIHKYFWRVRAWVSGESGSWTIPFSFTVTTLVPTQLLPVNAIQTTNRTPTFDWSDPTGATSYDLQVSTSADFAALLIGLTVVPSTYTPASDMDLGLYYWRVRIHSTTDSTRWSSTWQFTIISAPQLVSFAINNGAAVTGSSQVTLNHSVLYAPTHYMASENVGFLGASWLPYTAEPLFTLSAASGVKTVYLKMKNAAGNSNTLQDQIDYQPSAGVQSAQGAQLPTQMMLSVFPNPFAGQTTIRLSPADAEVWIDIYDLLGRRVRSLHQTAGARSEMFLQWDGRDEHRCRLSSGIYYLRLRDRGTVICQVVLLNR